MISLKQDKQASTNGAFTMSLIKVAVAGVSGRMGRMLAQALVEHPKTTLHAALERQGHEWIGRDLGQELGKPYEGVTVMDDPLEVCRDIHAIVDFTTPKSTVALSKISAQARITHVIGTTGFAAEDLASLEAAARHAVIIRAGNMSLGVNLLTKLTEKISKALDEDFDIEIIEAHHRHKVDAPSGTALMLGEAAALGRGVSLDEVADRARDGITGARARGAIGFHAIRGGDIVGEHDVVFAAEGERIILRHIATDRRIFVRGALKAVLWGQNQKPGAYDMLDVLDL